MPAPVTIYDGAGNVVRVIDPTQLGARCRCGLPPSKKHRCTDIQVGKRNLASYAPQGRGIEARFTR